jgi:hypothetical protein
MVSSPTESGKPMAAGGDRLVRLEVRLLRVMLVARSWGRRVRRRRLRGVRRGGAKRTIAVRVLLRSASHHALLP